MGLSPSEPFQSPAKSSVRAIGPRWIRTPYCAVNLAQVCRIEYRRSDVSREEINGFDLYLVDGTAVALERGDNGFERLVAELREQGVEVAVEGEAAGE
jgi:hypothetical protein